MTKHLFVDREHVEMIHGLRQTFHQPEKHPEPVLAPELPWEDDRVRVSAAPLWDAERGVWRMWYYGGEKLLPLYAESADGLEWKRPALGRVEWNGSAANNIVNARKLESVEENHPSPHCLFVRDEREPDESKRYKGFGWAREKGAGSFLVPCVSANAFDWTPLEGADLIPCEDTKRMLLDRLQNRYAAFVKGLTGCGVQKYGAAELGRIVYLSLSDDFVHWSEPELVFHSDEIDRELGRQRIEEAVSNPDRRGPLANRPDEYFTDVYYLPVFVYEDMYLAVAPLFHQSGHFFSPWGPSNQDGLLTPSLVASRDLRRWDRLDRAVFIKPSLLSDPNRYDHGGIYVCPPVRNGDELWFYYFGSRFTHVNPKMIEHAGLRGSPDEPMTAVYLAKMRLDGFASLDAGDDPGILLTKPLEVTGSRLRVNADAVGGAIRVELRDAVTGRGLPGYSMGDYMGSRVLWSEDGKRGRLRIGPGARFEDDPEADDTVPLSDDSTSAEVAWKGGADLSALKGREVRLFFHMQNARLFSYWFSDA